MSFSPHDKSDKLREYEPLGKEFKRLHKEKRIVEIQLRMVEQDINNHVYDKCNVCGQRVPWYSHNPSDCEAFCWKSLEKVLDV